jgi:hypothetical protein
MSMKRSQTGGRTSGGGSSEGAKLSKDDLFRELKSLAGVGSDVGPEEISRITGAGEPIVARALLGLAAENYLEKAGVGRYRVPATFAEVDETEFGKAVMRASKMDVTRQRDLTEIARLKQNNDIMRARLLAAVAERDHYLSVLKKNGIDPGPPAAPTPGGNAGPPPNADVQLPGLPESSVLPSGPGVGDAPVRPGSDDDDNG